MITSLPGLSWTALPVSNNSGSICLVFYKCTKAGFFRLLLQQPYLPHHEKRPEESGLLLFHVING
jgi:hypothetical protein